MVLPTRMPLSECADPRVDVSRLGDCVMVKRYLEWLETKGYSPRGTLEETIVRIANKGHCVLDSLSIVIDESKKA